MYRYQVNFEKVFVAGVLVGLRYTNDYLRFATWHDAEAFRLKCDGKTVVNAIGGADYIRECAILSAIEPTSTLKESA